MSEMTTEMAQLTELTLDPSNARKHGKRSLEEITASLDAFGQQKNVVVDADGVVLSGNGMVQAARALGWKTIAVHRSELSGDAAIAYAIADNRTAEHSSWNVDELERQVDALRGTQLEVSIGFNAAEIAKLVEVKLPKAGSPVVSNVAPGCALIEIEVPTEKLGEVVEAVQAAVAAFDGVTVSAS